MKWYAVLAYGIGALLLTAVILTLAWRETRHGFLSRTLVVYLTGFTLAVALPLFIWSWVRMLGAVS